MMMQSHRAQLAALAGTLVAVLALTFAPAGAKVKTGSQIFQGLVQHISPNNIKVTNPATKQTLSFLIVPHFDKIFKGDGQTTQQEAALKEGQYVKVYYDQKAFGTRHADRILILNNANMAMGKQKG
jgi:hypothetical protein